jgi:tetratricopeptide (TPR) repeat protein/DNA-binding CsgD family transcriptional regulator
MLTARELYYADALHIYNAIQDARLVDDNHLIQKGLEELKQYADEHSSAYHYSEYYIIRGALAQQMGDFSSALREFLSAGEYTNDVPVFQVAHIHSLIGAAYAHLGLTNEAMKHYIIVSDNMPQGGDIKGMEVYASSLADAGMIQLDARHFGKAKEYIYNALNAIESIPDANKRHYSFILNILGSYFLATNEYENALSTFRRSLNIKLEINHTRGITYTIGKIARTYLMLGDIDQAKCEYLRALALAPHGDYALRLSLLKGIADTCLKGNENEQAHTYALEAFSFADKCPSDSDRANIYELLSRTYYALGDYQNAYLSHVHYTEYFSASETRISSQRLDSLTVTYDIERSQSDLRFAKFKNEQLEKEVEHKNAELALLAMNLSQRNEMMAKLRQEVQQLKENSYTTNEALSILDTELQSNMNAEKTWQVFEQKFKNLHGNFMRDLSSAYPSLTPTEIRVCAMIKINMASKEIANILCVETKSVEIYRFRIRKKLALSVSDNLQLYLSQLQFNGVSVR